MAHSFNLHVSYNDFVSSNYNNNAPSQAGPSLRVTDQSTNYVPSNYNNSQAVLMGHNSYNTQAGPSYVPPFNYDDHNAHNHGQYHMPKSLYDHPHYPKDLSTFNNMSGIAPNPHHIQMPQLYDDNNDTDPTPEPQYNPITEGKIPHQKNAYLPF
ncbi:hypothetical protein P692DRAFT_20882426 [Suillus brevipes Sb2]|nr:hypothetical protein P692DRAFT_20882426 [Suillus brevipes Sb2]